MDRLEEYTSSPSRRKDHNGENEKQAVAELGQTQVKLEVVNDVVVKVRI